MEFAIPLVVLVVLGIFVLAFLPRGRRHGDPVVEDRPAGRD
jgi:hypothetical protein